MLKTVEATIDEQGNVKLVKPIQLRRPLRAFVTIFSEELDVPATALSNLSEAALAEDWLSPEEDAAWAHLQHLTPEKSS